MAGEELVMPSFGAGDERKTAEGVEDVMHLRLLENTLHVWR
jgi:hypothetical protein